MKPHTRNTPTERRCPECEGAGVVQPQRWTAVYDSEMTCGICAGRGWIRTAPYDPICSLSAWRRKYRSNPLAWGGRYGEIRQKVVSPVTLPDLRK